MALSSCKHIASSPPASIPDFDARSLRKDGFSSRITFPQRDPNSDKRRNVVSLQAFKVASLPPSVSAGGVSIVEPPGSEGSEVLHAKDVAVEEVIKDNYTHENLLTELKRSQLENQWGRNTHIMQGHSRQGSCTRLSARQRRILSRKREKGSSIESNCMPPERHADAVSASLGGMPYQNRTERPDDRCWAPNSGNEVLLRALGTVSTLGYLRGKVSKDLLTKEEEALLAKKMKVGQNMRAARERLTKALGQEPSDESWALSMKLSHKELQEKLLEADQARDYMFMANLRLVMSIAKKYSSLGINLADLVQEGAAGLLRGLEKFDYKKGFKLSTYVHWWIRQGVTQALGRYSKTVRVPPYMQAKLTLVARTIVKFKERGVPVSVRNLSAVLNMPEEVVLVALKAMRRIKSLDKPKDWGGFSPAEGNSLHHYVADLRVDNDPWHIIDNMSLREHVDLLMTSTLCKREQEIVRLYYGFECPEGQGISFHKIGQRMGISRERARQLEVRALRKLIVAGREMDMDVPLSR